MSHVCAVLAHVRSLFAQLPMLLKELISCVLLALVYLRQFIADLPVMLLKWDGGKVVEEEKEVISSVVNSFVWGREEEEAPRLISEALRRWWTTG